MEYRSLGSMVMAVGFALATIGLGLFLWKGGMFYILIILSIMLLVGVGVLKEPIDDYYFKKNPPKMDDSLIAALKKEYPMLNQFNEESLKEFSIRLALFLVRKDAYLVTSETEDLDTYHAALIATPAVIMNMGLPRDSMNDIKKLVAYRHPFPSPKMPFIHSSEIDMEDGVAIASLEQLFMSTRKPKQYYHIVFHLWASYFYQKNYNQDLPSIPETFRQDISKIFPYSENEITAILGYDSYKNFELATVAYFLYPNELRHHYPDVARSLDGLFIKTNNA